MNMQEILSTLLRRQQTLAVAESLTGGLFASCLVDNPGASQVFRGGCVTYATDTKSQVLGVKEQILADYGPVDPVVALEMAAGVAKLYNARIGVATTGVAGPKAQGGKPVGCVYVAAVNQQLLRNTTQSYADLHAVLENIRCLNISETQLDGESELKVVAGRLATVPVKISQIEENDLYQQLVPDEWIDKAVVYRIQIEGNRRAIREKTVEVAAFVTNKWLNRGV